MRRPLLIAICISLLGLVGCRDTDTAGNPSTKGQPQVLSPINLANLKDRTLAENPGATALALLDQSGKGFVFSEGNDGTFIAFGAISDLQTDTTVTEVQGNRACFAKSGGWNGACIEAFSKGSGSDEYLVRVDYATGRDFSYDAEAVAMWEAGKAENVYETHLAFQTVRRGPSASKGVVYYFAGHTTGRPTPMNDNIVPPYAVFLNTLGWDVFRANPPIALRTNKNHAFLADNMNDLAEKARSEGYEKVVMVGQSFGSYGVVQAAPKARFDKFIAVAPASGGAVSAGNPRKSGLMARIAPAAAASRVPGVIFLFNNDEYYKETTQDAIAEARYARVHVEDRPDDFIGHGSAWLDAFEFFYGECLARFVQNEGQSFRCTKPRVSTSDHRWMANAEHLRSGGAQLVSISEFKSAFVGRTLAGRAGDEIVNAYFSSDRNVQLEFRSGYAQGRVESATYSFNDNGEFCSSNAFFQGQCYEIYQWPSDNLYFAVAPSGGIVFRGRTFAGDARQLN